MRILSEEQKNLVEKNHGLIFGFAIKNNLLIDDYYDILAIGLCMAALSYNPSKGEFSTLAYTCMGNEVKKYWKNITCSKNSPEESVISYDSSIDAEHTLTDSSSVYDNFDDILNRIFYSSFYDTLNKKEQIIFDDIVNGMTRKEIGNKLGCTHQNVSLIVKNIRKKLKLYIKKA